ncbi:hypothetical protein [Streptacidiphilus carbonis]|uniref:hypothetical protein n=1 Tax=Streptacidiphilus carbonis TaxID=105422 RepID=UPI000A4E0FE1|nr:hypothetical protein [Streptacidiphilus carbonis]
MGYVYTFDLSPEEVEGLLADPGKSSGFLAALKRKTLAAAKARIVERSTGPTTVELFETGLRLTDPRAVRELRWADVHYVMERPGVWSTQDVAHGVVLIPGSAVPESERAALAQQLRAWVGAKYKVREGGMVGAG